jgi:hypothetical protein
MAVTLDQLLFGIREVETGGIKDRYKIVNSIGAHGAYQVMRANIGPWTKEALGRAYTPAEFLASPAAQDKVARFKLGASMKKYGWEGAAAVWFSGQPNPNSTSSDGGNTVRQYVDKVKKAILGGGKITSAGLDPLDVVPGVGAVSGLVDIVKGMSGSMKSMAEAMLNVGVVASMLTRIALPQMMMRIACGIMGTVFLLLGLLVLGREAKGE